MRVTLVTQPEKVRAQLMHFYHVCKPTRPSQNECTSCPIVAVDVLAVLFPLQRGAHGRTVVHVGVRGVIRRHSRIAHGIGCPTGFRRAGRSGS